MYKTYKLNKENEMEIIVAIIAFSITTAVLFIAFNEMK